MAQVTVNKARIEREQGVVILPLREYQKLLRKAVPTYYLTGKAAKDLDKLVDEGLKEYKTGKTIRAGSIKQALRLYERRNKR